MILMTRMHGCAVCGCVLALSLSCARPALRREVAEPTQAGQCEDAAAFVAAHQRGPATSTRLRQVVAIPLSIIATGLGYATDVVLLTTGGLVVSVVVCAPVIAVEAAVDSNGDSSGRCIGDLMSAVIDDGPLPGIGEGIYDATREWRCTDLTPLCRELREIAGCYARRGGPGDLERAREQLLVIRKSAQLYGCAATQEKQAVDSDLADVEHLLAP